MRIIKHLSWAFCGAGCNCWFIFVLHFVVVSSFQFWFSFSCCFSFVDVLHLHLLFDVILHPSVDYHWVFTPILYFQPGPSQSDLQNFHFQQFRYLLTPSATVLSGRFLPTGVFYLTLLHWHFTCVYQGLPGSRQFFLEVCRASYWSSKHRPGPSVCLIHSNPQSSYSERFSFKFYHILSWIACGESLIYLLLTRFELFSLVQSHM